MTTELRYLLTPRGRLSPGARGQSGNSREVHEIIPGTTVRGALGSAWWTSPTDAFEPASPQEQRQALFDRLFGGLLSVGQAEPTIDPAGPPSRQIATFQPNSVFACKYRCGAAPLDQAMPSGPHCPSCAPDGPSQSSAICPKCERCPNCAQPPERGIRAVAGKGWTVNPRANTKTLVTRTALVNSIPREGALFTREVLEATARVGKELRPLRYAGTLVLRDGADAPELALALAWLRGIRRVRVGGSLSTMGACDIEITDLERAHQVVDTDSPVALYLTSPAVLVDDGGVASLDFASAVQSAALAAGAPEARVARMWMRSGVTSGWHSVAGLPKPQDPVVEAGAVALVEGLTPGALRALIDDGVGIRRLEGFGRLTTHPHGAESDAREEPASPMLAVSTPGSEGSTQTGSAVDVGGASPPPVSGPLDNLLAAIPPGSRAQVRSRLLDALRTTERIRQSGGKDDVVGSHAMRTLGKPWARDLSGPLRDLVEEIVMAAETLPLIHELEDPTRGAE